MTASTLSKLPPQEKGAAGRGRKKAPVSEVVEAVMPRRQAQRRVDQPGWGDGLDLQTLGGRLAWARLRENVTQEALAKVIERGRPTVVQYEANNIVPPIDIIERLASHLKVSPSFLAFGEHGIQTNGNPGEDVINVDEISFGRDGSYKSGTFALPRDRVSSYVSNPRHLKVYVMNHHANLFDLRTGDCVFCDTSINAITNQHDSYLLDTGGGMEIVRIPPSLTKGATIDLLGPNGEPMNAKVRDLTIIGAVVSTLRQK